MGESPTTAGDSGDFIISSGSGVIAPPTPALEPAAPVEATPSVEVAPESPPAADAPAAADEGLIASEEADDPAVAAAAAKLPTGDSQSGKTLSARARVIQAEIHHLTSQKHQTRQEIDAERAALAEVRAERERLYAEIAQRTPPVAEAVKPKSADYDTFEDFSDALGQYYRDEATRASLAQTQQAIQDVLAQERERAQQAQQAQYLQQVYAKHQTNIDAARAAHPDFDEVVAGSALPTNPMMETHIPQSSLSGELLHYLATHPDECMEIARLPPGPTLVALGRLEARIEGVKSGPPAIRPPVVSKAQRPIKPVGASSSTADEVPDERASLDEHAAYWNRKEREQRSGRR